MLLLFLQYFSLINAAFVSTRLLSKTCINLTAAKLLNGVVYILNQNADKSRIDIFSSGRNTFL